MNKEEIERALYEYSENVEAFQKVTSKMLQESELFDICCLGYNDYGEKEQAIIYHSFLTLIGHYYHFIENRITYVLNLRGKDAYEDPKYAEFYSFLMKKLEEKLKGKPGSSNKAKSLFKEKPEGDFRTFFRRCLGYHIKKLFYNFLKETGFETLQNPDLEPKKTTHRKNENLDKAYSIVCQTLQNFFQNKKILKKELVYCLHEFPTAMVRKALQDERIHEITKTKKGDNQERTYQETIEILDCACKENQSRVQAKIMQDKNYEDEISCIYKEKLKIWERIDKANQDIFLGKSRLEDLIKQNKSDDKLSKLYKNLAKNENKIIKQHDKYDKQEEKQQVYLKKLRKFSALCHETIAQVANVTKDKVYDYLKEIRIDINFKAILEDHFDQDNTGKDNDENTNAG